jgi:hypothetical protein
VLHDLKNIQKGTVECMMGMHGWEPGLSVVLHTLKPHLKSAWWFCRVGGCGGWNGGLKHYWNRFRSNSWLPHVCDSFLSVAF